MWCVLVRNTFDCCGMCSVVYIVRCMQYGVVVIGDLAYSTWHIIPHQPLYCRSTVIKPYNKPLTEIEDHSKETPKETEVRTRSTVMLLCDC